MISDYSTHFLIYPVLYTIPLWLYYLFRYNIMSFGSNLNIIFYSDLVVSKKCNVTNNLLSTPRQFPLGAGLIPIILYCAFPRYNVTDSHFLVLIR